MTVPSVWDRLTSVQEFSEMRRFTLGSAPDRKIVVIELDGSRMSVVQMMPDGRTKRSEKGLNSPAEARSASEKMARELIARGFVEQYESGAEPAKAKSAVITVKPTAPARDLDEIDGDNLFELDEAPVATPAPVLARLATASATETVPAPGPGLPKKKKKKGGKKKKKADSGDALDKRVLAGIGAVGALAIAFLGYMIYDAFIKPPSIVGVWRGSRLDHEVSRYITHTEYGLILDARKNASMTVEKATSKGTYSVKGNRLKLTFKDEDGETSEHEYKIVLGRATLELHDPESGKLLVELIRQSREKPVVGGGADAPPAEAPTDVALRDPGKVDKSADERLASVQFSPKDNAFRLRHPKDWEVETSSRPDNTYSSAIFTDGSAKIEVYADVAGSLMTGSPANQYEEGSELAPVHRAHELYKRTAEEAFSNFKETKPTLFKGSSLGEGRLSEFTASEGLIFSSKLKGYHVTLLTNDRRISILCHCPEGEFEKRKPTFLAVCRSFAR
jgi:hypothetical protein